jgi:hypothetical protein
VPARAWLWLTIALTAGAFTVAAALAPPASAVPGRGLAGVLFVGSSAHVASTGWLYTLGDVRSYTASRPLRLRWVPAALLLSGALAAALLPPARFAWLLLWPACCALSSDRGTGSGSDHGVTGAAALHRG